jgi:hypothetical protein
MHRRREPAPLDIRAWTEPVDDKHFAVVAFAESVGNQGRWRAFSCFLVLDKASHGGAWGYRHQHYWREKVVAYFSEVLQKDHGGRPPVVRDDVNWRRFQLPE